MTENKKESATQTRVRCMEDWQFRRWHETLALKNENSAEAYAQMVVRLTRLVGLDPLAYVALFREDPEAFDDTTQDILNAMVRAGRAEANIKTSMSALKHWREWSRCKLGRKLVMGRVPKRPVASKQRIPAQETLRRVLDALDTRSRVCLAFRTFAGLRPGILGNRKGSDGLRLGHLEGLRLAGDGRGYEVEGTTLKVNVPEALSKNGRAFFSFLGGEGVEYLSAYLDRRIANGEALGPESPVIAPIKSCNRDGHGEFVKRDTLTEPLSAAMKAVGVHDSPYIWRSYFKTQLIIAQSKKGLLGEYVEFWMGHDGGIKSVYSFHKEVSDEVVQEMRSAYEAKAMQFLETRRRPGEGMTEGEITRVAMETFDVPADVLDGLDLEGIAGDELRDVMRKYRDEAIQRLVKEAMPGMSAQVGGGLVARQLVVAIGDVQEYVARGWRYVYEARLPEGQALVEVANAPLVVAADVAVAIQ